MKIREKIETNKPAKILLDLSTVDKSSDVYLILSRINSKTKFSSIEKDLFWDDKKNTELINISKSILDANETEVNKKVKELVVKQSKLQRFRNDHLSLEKLLTNERLLSLIQKNKDHGILKPIEYDRIYEEEYDVEDLQMFVNDSDYNGYNDTLE